MPEIRGLYVLIDPAACRGRDAVEIGRAALAGGANLIQWRDKLRDKGEQLAPAVALAKLCRDAEAIFILNDHADLALAVAQAVPDAAVGVHLGQKDLPLAAVRAMVPPGLVVGVSTNNVDEARVAAADGASYIAVGDIFGTTVKVGTRPASPQRLAEVKQGVALPVVAIGGINVGNIEEVLAAGADAVAVISAVCAADVPELAVQELVAAFGRGRTG